MKLTQQLELKLQQKQVSNRPQNQPESLDKLGQECRADLEGDGYESEEWGAAMGGTEGAGGEALGLVGRQGRSAQRRPWRCTRRDLPAAASPLRQCCHLP